MFRTTGGVPTAMEDRCAHRSFPLSAGRLDDDTIICGYHGLRYDAAGECVEIPSQVFCPKGIGVRSYPLVERGPLSGDGSAKLASANPELIPATPWLEDGRWCPRRIIRFAGKLRQSA